MPTLWALLSPETQETVLAATDESSENVPPELQTLDGPGGKPTNSGAMRDDTSRTDPTTTALEGGDSDHGNGTCKRAHSAYRLSAAAGKEAGETGWAAESSVRLRAVVDK
ncbi:hypothetical protein LTR74_002117 [Friedmanniomyces endolithicus]|nr:hypothetical protein LTR74_002117 [Friedmanniomyces endolithicus]